MKRLITYSKPYLIYIIFAALASIGCSLANVWIIDVLKKVIDMTVSQDTAGKWINLILSATGAVVVGMCANYLVIAMTGRFGAGVLRDLRRDAVNHLMKVSPDFMEHSNFGDIMERLSSDVEGLARYMEGYFKDCLYVPVIVVVFAVYLALQNPFLAFVCLAPLVVMVPLSVILLKPIKLSQFDYVRKLGLTNNNIQEVFDGVDVIKSYNLQSRLGRKYYKDLKVTLDISNVNDLRQYNIEPLSCLIREAPTAIALCLGGYLALKGEVTLGMLVAFISSIEKINEPLVGVYQLVVRSQMAMVSVKRVFEIMEMPCEKVSDNQELSDDECSQVFSLENVTFSYSNGTVTQNVVENINFSVKKGERVALVGRSGCGKSTIIKLLCRQYNVDSGKYVFYDRNVDELDADTVRGKLALISQDTVIFPISVSDNIRIGRPDATQEEIANAAKLAGCNFIDDLPDGYNTVMEEHGANLSGGQRQRIAIARAILKDTPVLLLDEPTSALDAQTEEFVSRTLTDVSEGRTVVTVAHRLSTIKDYDRIVVMESGKIVEEGTHEELMGLKGRYFNMVSGGVV